MPEVGKKLCFVVGPIGDAGSEIRTHADWLLHGIIEPVFTEHFKDYKVERADKITTPGMIDAQVINRLLDAPLVIADMSHLNANAFYEMGIRHMKALPIIHMYLEGSKIPFDVAPYRAIPFKYIHPNDLNTARSGLKTVVEEIIKPDFKVDNPITRARGVEKFEERATEGQKVILDELRAIKDRLRLLENGSESWPSEPGEDEALVNLLSDTGARFTLQDALKKLGDKDKRRLYLDAARRAVSKTRGG